MTQQIKQAKMKPDFIDTEIHDVPVRVHYTFEKGCEGQSDRIDIVKVTHLGKDVPTAFSIALYGETLEEEISKWENADHIPDHDD